LAKTQVNFLAEEELIKGIDSMVDRSKHKYNNRSHYIILAISDKLQKDKEQTTQEANQNG